MAFVEFIKDLPYADHAFGVAEEAGENIEDVIRHYTEQLGPIAHMRQVHGDRVVYASGPGMYEEADAIYTDHSDVWLAVKTADCVPVLVSCPSAVAAVHCGWRGLKNEILPKTLDILMNEFQGTPTELFVHIGPCIQQRNYEVDESFMHDFDESFFRESEKSGKVLFDMPSVVRKQAMDMGINDLNIHNTDMCTFADNRFHSYRRHKKDGEEGYRVQLSLVRRDVEGH
jgi:YfiH family protein